MSTSQTINTLRAPIHTSHTSSIKGVDSSLPSLPFFFTSPSLTFPWQLWVSLMHTNRRDAEDEDDVDDEDAPLPSFSSVCVPFPAPFPVPFHPPPLPSSHCPAAQPASTRLW
jgi:hypothetical protein